MRLDEATARQRFGVARVARLATVDTEGQPHLVPVTFAVRDDTVVIAVDNKPKTTQRLKRLRNIEAANSPSNVSLLVDHYDEDWTKLWWVRADGAADVLYSADDRAEPLHWLSEKYPQYQHDPPAGPVIRISVTTWRGWSYG